MPSNILTVYRLSVSSEQLIAKKVREESNELEALQLLNTIQPKSDHVISLIDSFHGGQSGQWAILPKMNSVTDYAVFAPGQLESKVVQVCLGLVKGLAYLHEHRIAHRDIKPDNLLVDQDFCLKIIDFDFAIRVKDEDEEVDGQCGTVHWIAPEVEKKLNHSPIKADRWTCGHVLLVLLDKFRKEDKLLRAFARNLKSYNPKRRPSLLEWRSYLAARHSDVGNVWNADIRKAWRPRQDSMEVDGEDAKPPNAKKQRLDGPERVGS
jgi:serine/threonine protein kinase